MMYLIHGEDAFQREALLRAIRARYRETNPTALSETVLDGGDPDAIDRFAAALAAAGGLFEQRGIIIARRFLTASVRSATFAVLDHARPAERKDVHVIFVEDGVVSDIPSGIQVQRCDLLGPAARKRWIARYVAEHGPEAGPKRIAPPAAALLAAESEDRLWIAAELEKAMLFALGEEEILPSHLDLPVRADTNAYAIADAIGDRDPLRALRALLNFADDDRETARMLGLLVQSARRLAWAIAARSADIAAPAAQAIFQVRPAAWARSDRRAGRWGAAEIPRLLREAARLEYRWKRGTDKPLAAAAFIGTLGEGREKK